MLQTHLPRPWLALSWPERPSPRIPAAAASGVHPALWPTGPGCRRTSEGRRKRSRECKVTSKAETQVVALHSDK